MSAPTVIRVAYNGFKTLQVVTYFERGEFLAALQEYSVNGDGHTVMETNTVYTSEGSAIAAWLDRAAV